MFHLRLILLTFLYFYNHIQANKGRTFFDSYDFSRPWDLRTNFGKDKPILITKAYDSLFYVYVNDKSDNIEVQFLNLQKNCTIFLNAKYEFAPKREVRALGNGKVLLKMHAIIIDRNETRLIAVSDKVMLTIIDPNDCTYHPVELQDKPDNNKLIDVLMYNSSFDVISRVDTRMDVVRYTDEGEIEQFSAFIPDVKLHDIRMVKEYDPSEGYFCRIYSVLDMFTLKKLNSNFEVVKNYELQRPITYLRNGYAVEYNRFTICYDGYYNQPGRTKCMKCEIMDEALTNKFSEVHMCEKVIRIISVKNLPEGGAMIAYGVQLAILNQTTHLGEYWAVYLQHLSEEGSVSQPLLIGNVTGSIVSAQNFEMNDNSYCISIKVAYSTFSIMTKCIVPLKH